MKVMIFSEESDGRYKKTVEQQYPPCSHVDIEWLYGGDGGKTVARWCTDCGALQKEHHSLRGSYAGKWQVAKVAGRVLL